MANKKVMVIKGNDIELVKEGKDRENEKTAPPKKVVLTLFLFLLPILLLAYSQEMVTKIALFFYEAVLLQNYIMDQYKKKDTV